MDKRGFLKSTLAGAGALGLSTPAPAQSRLFGTPGSVIPITPAVTNQLHLTMSRLSLPTSAWDLLVGTIAAVQELASSASARAAFASAPTQFFADRGLPAGTFEPDSPELAMARLVTDEAAQQAAAAGDYVTFLRRLQEFRLGTIPSPDGLAGRITSLLKDNVDAYMAMKSALSGPDAGDAPALRATLEHGAIAKVGAGVAGADVILQVSVDTEVLLLLDVAVDIAVVAGGRHQQQRMPVDGLQPKFAQLDPDLMEFATNATMGARLLGNRQFEVSVAKDVVRQEVESLISAMESVGLVALGADEHAAMVELAAQRSWDGLGLS